MSNDNESVPPLAYSYRALLSEQEKIEHCDHGGSCAVVQECELPLIDVSGLSSCDRGVRQACVEAIVRASSEWGFFQVVNHGVSSELLSRIKMEQIKLFDLPFEKKTGAKFLRDSYSWGTPTAKSARQFSWSESFHVPLSKFSEDCSFGEFDSLREAMQELAEVMCELARTLAGVLAEKLGYVGRAFPEDCSRSTCFLRLNHYPPCPFSSVETFGLVPHTDSDFLTILHQDQVGGLQLMKDSKWFAVKPNPDALIVNIGDLFQAWSNDIYKSVVHKAMTNKEMGRYSTAYFLCPSFGSVIGSCKVPPLYRSFTFGEFREQVKKDVQRTGHKVGLPRFLL